MCGIYDANLILDLIRPWVIPEKIDESIDAFRKYEFGENSEEASSIKYRFKTNDGRPFYASGLPLEYDDATPKSEKLKKHAQAIKAMDQASSNVDKIKIAIRAFFENEPRGGFAIFYATDKKDYFVQCCGQTSTFLHCEAVSNEHLKPKLRLNEDQISRLLSLGWSAPISGDPNYRNFSKDLDSLDDGKLSRLAREILSTLEVYGFLNNQPLKIELNLE